MVIGLGGGQAGLRDLLAARCQETRDLQKQHCLRLQAPQRLLSAEASLCLLCLPLWKAVAELEMLSKPTAMHPSTS